jgi:hypothetical protein
VHQGIVLAWVGIYVSWFHGVLRYRKIGKKIVGGGGGGTLGSCSSLASLQVFQVDFHHPLEHLSRFGIFGKSDVLQV